MHVPWHFRYLGNALGIATNFPLQLPRVDGSLVNLTTGYLPPSLTLNLLTTLDPDTPGDEWEHQFVTMYGFLNDRHIDYAFENYIAVYSQNWISYVNSSHSVHCF